MILVSGFSAPIQSMIKYPSSKRALVSAVTGACLAWSAIAAAQTSAQPETPAKPPEAAPAVSGVVTVTAERPTNRIDRQVYDQKAEVGATNNSAADALNNVPSVTVDPDGTVSLRGSTNVQILVDGKPSAMLQGDGRGAALNAMPAQDIESIEVINNPGAQFGNEGGGGPILNLVMRRNRTPGGNGVASLNAGPNGRANGSLSGSYHEGKWGYQGAVNFRRDGRNAFGFTERERINPATGEVSASRQDARSTGLNDSHGLNGGVTYNYDDKTAFGAQLSYMRRGNDQHGTDIYQYDDQATPALSDYVRTSERSGASTNSSVGLRMDHKGDVAGETFKLDLRVSSQDNDSDSAYTNLYSDTGNTIPLPQRRSRQHNDASNSITDFTGDYERPTTSGLVKLGFKIADTENGFDTSYFDIDPLSGATIVNPGRTNRFEVDERNLAVYGSYQHRLNERWGILGGLRVEHTDLDVYQITAATTASNSYINYVPSMFVSYKASDNANLRFSYAHRIRRPNGNDLNPFIVYRDEFNVSAGNPQLRPSETDSFELGYETKFGVVDTNLRAYFRKDKDLISERSYFISDTVLLTTRENAGSNRSGGLEFSLSGKLTPWLNFNTSGNVARTEQRGVDNAGVVTVRNATALTLRGRVSVTLSPKDTMQFSVNTQGKTLTAQGYREPQTTANLNYRRALTPRLSLLINVTDLFDSNKMASRIDTSYLHEQTERRYDGRIAYIGLSYRFGGLNNAGSNRQPGGRGQPGQGGPRNGGPGPGPAGEGPQEG
ncbi:MAG TPA: TonB-dependent receptor [Telluria sp.]|jgi:outer membrane receptor protein involved in Fe transport